MKRDMELVRQILIAINDDEHGFAPNLEIEGYTPDQIGYHVFILHEARLLVAKDITNLDSLTPIAKPSRLTWKGHEFVENAQNEEAWGQAKQAVSKLGDVSFTVWSTVLSQIVMKQLGIS